MLLAPYTSTRVWADGPAATYVIRDSKYIGEYTEIDGKLIHLVINRKGEGE
jgi:hypothetical protein